MPVYRLNIGGTEGALAFHALDLFTQGYVTAAFWQGDEDSGIPDLGFEELNPDALASMVETCAEFQRDNEAALKIAYEGGQAARGGRDPYFPFVAGVDLYLTRNGHGAGFWDRGLAGQSGTDLSNAARRLGESSLYAGDDHRLYLL